MTKRKKDKPKRKRWRSTGLEQQLAHAVKRNRNNLTFDVPKELLPPPPFKPRNLDELIKLGLLAKNKEFIDTQKLGPIVEPLQALQRMIGIPHIKQHLVEMVMLRLQGGNIAMPHMAILGPPGCGKTTLTQIVGQLCAGLGVLSSGHVVHGKPSNMVSGFVGQTAPKMEKLIESAFGGVLLIDEVYALSDNRTSKSGDSFSKKAIDTLNMYLDKHADKFVLIVAGYEKEVERDFFGVNPGLKRRIPVKLVIEPYSPADLKAMTMQQLKKQEYEMQGVLPDSLFTPELFPDSGGSVLLFVDRIKHAQGLRVYGQLKKDVLTQEDIDVAVKKLKDLNKKSKPEPMLSMYM